MAGSRSRRRIVVALVAAAVTAAAPLTAGAALAASPAAARRAPVVHRATVLLPTGDTVQVSTTPGAGTRTLVHPVSQSGVRGEWTGATVGGHHYVVPVVAGPYFGRQLDPALFDVAARTATDARIDVRVTGPDAAIPGLTLTRRGGAGEEGYFTPEGARRFGVALAGVLDAPRHDGTLFGATAITSAGAVRPITPTYQQETVVFRSTDVPGAKALFGDVLYTSTDDGRRASGDLPLVGGEGRISLPVGHYSFIATTADTTGQEVAFRVVTAPDITVGTRNGQVVPVDFRRATTEPSIAVPRPAALESFTADWNRTVPNGELDAGYGLFGSGRLLVAPAAAPRRGTVTWSTAFTETGTAPGSAYHYDADFAEHGAIPADQHHRLHAAQLATVHERFFSDKSARHVYFGHGVVDASGDGSQVLTRIRAPLTRTDYLYAPAGTHWADSLVLIPPTDTSMFVGEVDDGLRSYRAGRTYTDAWQQPLIAPSIPSSTSADREAGVFCPACRTAKQIAVETVPVQDSAADGHYGFIGAFDDGTVVAAASLYRGGKLIDRETGDTGAFAEIPAGPAHFRFVAQTFDGRAGLQLSTRATTTLTFVSSAGTGAKAPPDSCPVEGADCRVLPLLRITAPLPTDLTGTMTTGEHPFDLTVAPIQGAAPATVTATVRLSFDGGRSYTDQPVTALGGDRFRVTLTNPSTSGGSKPLLQIHGSDAAGSTITETVHAAYRVAG